MSVLQGVGFNGVNQLSTAHEVVPNRHISDNFSSSRSYAPEYHAQSAFAAQRRVCEQLREEAKRERVKVSIVCKDLVQYIADHQSSDALVVGFPSVKVNPYRDPGPCRLF